ncbi:TetR/AcrR family transcriptional regulator [Neobacillus sp. D3-1R]|uniref:TetR/AcrR family transcriptional regulator n=1 Tax=Neobacillus sp. D3-1R TaxID=3445778 RepID=UPI003FA03472
MILIKVNEKEKVIIEEAIKLFAKKGFSSTSIQEIANNSGISKGAFYLHFKSKDALLLAIFHYYHQSFKKEIFEFKNDTYNPREKFTHQLKILFQKLLDHKEFLIMITKEQAVPKNDSTKKLIYTMRLETLQFYRNGFTSIYGLESKPYLWDLSVLMDGLIQSFNRILLFDFEQIDLNELAEYLLKRMDSIYKDLLDEQPLFSESVMDKILFKTKSFLSKETEQIHQIFTEMRMQLDNIEDKENLEISLDVLEAEVSREKPRTAVIQGMLSNFSGVQQFDKHIHQILTIFQLPKVEK